jgi:hypothetical protein
MLMALMVERRIFRFLKMSRKEFSCQTTDETDFKRKGRRFSRPSIDVILYFGKRIRSASFTFGKTFGKSSRLITPSARIEKRWKR